MWRNVGGVQECVLVDGAVFERKNCKLYEEICNWKKNTCPYEWKQMFLAFWQYRKFLIFYVNPKKYLMHI